MDNSIKLLEVFCRAANSIKRSGLAAESLDPASYLGGDLGIDSIEMLEIWFCMEKDLGLRLPDQVKREIFTVAQVLEVFLYHLDSAETQPPKES